MRNAVLVVLLVVPLGTLSADADGMLDPSFGNGARICGSAPAES